MGFKLDPLQVLKVGRVLDLFYVKFTFVSLEGERGAGGLEGDREGGGGRRRRVEKTEEGRKEGRKGGRR